MKPIKSIVFILLMITLYSCAEIFNGTILTNRCKKCDLLNAHTGEILFSLEGCGSENTNLEGKCETKAWALSRGRNLCDFDIVCESWKKEKG